MGRRSILTVLAGAVAGLFDGRRDGAEASEQSAVPTAPPDAPRDATEERMLAAIPYPRFQTTGADALRKWERLRAQGEGWPVIIGDDAALAFVAEQFSIDDPEVFPGTSGPGPASVEAILARAAQVRMPDALRARFEGPGMEEDDMPVAELGTWPDRVSGTPGLTVANDVLTGKPFARVHILLLPCSDGAEVPAYLRWGNWNDCPAPELHVAALRYWNAKYGLEVVGLNGDTLNLRIARPPRTREAAIQLAQEQYHYCTDIVDQGVESLSALGATLLGAK